MKIASKKSIAFFSYDLNHEKFLLIENYAKQALEIKNKISEIYFQYFYNKENIALNNPYYIPPKKEQKGFYKTNFILCMKNVRKELFPKFPAATFQQICMDVFEAYNKRKNKTKNQVEFKKLTITSTNVLTEKKMFEYSNNKYTNGIINFNIPNVIEIAIPFRHNKKYHGNLDKIKHSQLIHNNKSKKTDKIKQIIQYQKLYTVTILEKDKIKITISEDNEIDYIEPDLNSNILGVDVNAKHNLLQCSNGFSVDYNRKLLKKISRFQLKMDRKKSTKDNRNNKIREYNEKVIDDNKKKQELSTSFSLKDLMLNLKNSRRTRAMVEKCLVELFKYCQKNNIKNLVFENLNKFTGRDKFIIKNKEFDIKYKRLMANLHFVDIKNYSTRIARKYDISVSLINSELTSQECSCCHYIDKENRKSQENFKCINCGYEINADLNASINIKNRLSVNVLRERYLEINNETHQYVPIKYKHKEFIDDYKNLINNTYFN